MNTYILSSVVLMVSLMVAAKLSSPSVITSFFVRTLEVIGESMLLNGMSSPFKVSIVICNKKIC